LGIEGRLKVHWTLAEAAPGWDDPASLDWLSVQEKRRLELLRFPKRRAEWLLGRRTAKMLLLSSLASLRGIDPGSLSIENEPEGAPCAFQGGERLDLSLSISHRGRLALCAFCEGQDCSLGADIEKIESRNEVFAEDYFTRVEQNQLDGSAGAERDRLVTLIWSAKEAALKALLKGLRLDTRSVEISRISSVNSGWGGFMVRSDQTTAGVWRGWWQVWGEYVLTLALLGPRMAVENAIPEEKGKIVSV
jgi:4'-phosphopantetheinyl transferase